MTFSTLNLWAHLYPHFVLHGAGVFDRQLVEDDEQLRAPTLEFRMVEHLDALGYDFVVVAEPARGLRYRRFQENVELPPCVANLPELSPEIVGAQPWEDPIADLETVMRALPAAGGLGALVVLGAARFGSQPGRLGARERSLFALAQRLAEASPLRTSARSERELFPAVYWVASRETDLPPSYLAMPGVRALELVPPGMSQRQQFAAQELAQRLEKGYDAAELTELARSVAHETEGLSLRNTQAVVELCASGDTPWRAATVVRVGTPKAYWSDPHLRARATTLEAHLDRQVLGQHRATATMARLVANAAAGTDGLHQQGSATRPKFVALSVGPTGTGKTALYKAVHSFVFGSGQPGIVDMGEFANEASATRIGGASPGFVGYEAGGLVTGLVKSRPAQVMLFDEAEKMHPEIWKSFLTIIDEGRFTDGLGNPCFFDQTGLGFTSNLGQLNPATGLPRFSIDDDYPTIYEAVMDAVEQYFKVELGKPELLKRFNQENILVYDVLRPEYAGEIFDKMLDQAVVGFAERFGPQLLVEEEAREALRRFSCRDLSGGGRTISNAIESGFNVPLGVWLNAHGDRPLPDPFVVCNWSYDDGRSSLAVR